MDTGVHNVFLGHAPGMPHQQPPSSSSNTKLRKRTKTGCLTCRKRRIKCGEERPTCNNCYKSKRSCEGYSQRVIFRSPIEQWTGGQNASSTTIQYHSGMLPGQTKHEQSPPLQMFMPPGHPSVGQPAYAWDRQGQFAPVMPMTPMTPTASMSASPYMTLGTNGAPVHAQQEIAHATWQYRLHQSQVLPHQYHQPPVAAYANHSPIQASPFTRTSENVQAEQAHAGQAASTHGWHTAHSPAETIIPANITPGMPFHSHEDTTKQPPERPHLLHYVSDKSHRFDGDDIHGSSHHFTPSRFSTYDPMREDLLLPGGEPEQMVIKTTNELLQGAAVEAQDDDYNDYDPDMDDQALMMSPQEDLSLMRHIYQQNTSDSSMRRYDAFIYPGVLDHYHAEYHASPLKNERTARVFAHFVCATAPSLSIFERTPRNTEAIFGLFPAQHVRQQSLWTFALPMKALHNHGLLHAMLALASLHIANLQGADATPSLRHYSFALRSVHKAVASARKRHRVETLAATLLLGYYEVMTADHAKWCSHLLGAKQLLNEIAYPSMTGEIRRLRAEQQASRPITDHSYFRSPSQQDLNESLLSTIIGREVKYDKFGHVNPEELAAYDQQHSSPQDRVDSDTYDLYQDLWWWFLRQDAYQSIISGNDLLLSYSRWSDCPPRAPAGASNATYGTHDHIMLMLGRIADFSSRDRRRKLKYIKAHGGQWMPPQRGFFPGLGQMPPPLGQRPGAASQPAVHTREQASRSTPQTLSSPVVPSHSGTLPTHPAPPSVYKPTNSAVPQAPFMGMAPSFDRQSMPSSYQSTHPANNVTSPTSSDGSASADDALTAALQEWSDIQQALAVLRSTFHPMLQPIDSDMTVTPPDTVAAEPFGPAVHFRQFDIALLNTYYHLCSIVLCRAHPNMPPASMIPAGVASSFTTESAVQIGRIATGIFSQALSVLMTSRWGSNGTAEDTLPGLNPSIGGMLCEMGLPLFFAGVQYKEQSQREWLTDHLHEVEVRCGFATAGMIGHGCETAWCRQAEAGRGPAYSRRGIWAKSDADHDPKSPPPWSYGVRGGETDAPPPAGISALDGQQGLTTEGLPIRFKKLGSFVSNG